MSRLAAARARFASKVRPPEHVAAFAAWEAGEVERAQQFRTGRVEFNSNNWKLAKTDAAKVNTLALALADAVSTGQVPVEEATRHLEQLRAAYARAEGMFEAAQEEMATMAATDPIEAYELHLQRFPAMYARLPMPPIDD